MQYSIYEDGPRLIYVFNNNPDTRNKLNALLGLPSTATAITNVAPPPQKIGYANIEASNEIKQAPVIENPEKLLQEKGFAGFCSIYSYYKQNKQLLASDYRKKIEKIIYDYTTIMRNRDVDQISDEELKCILSLGSKYLFPNSIKSCLQQSGFISLNDFLESGRTNLIDAYLACVCSAA